MYAMIVCALIGYPECMQLQFSVDNYLLQALSLALIKYGDSLVWQAVCAWNEGGNFSQFADASSLAVASTHLSRMMG